jgi:L-alanine-DL-glutamate epimerase-like enolase superfamily enzyme
MAKLLIAHGRPVTLCADDHWAGVWDLERLTDEVAASWVLWVATKVGPFLGRGWNWTGVVG